MDKFRLKFIKTNKLIQIYFYVCDLYNTELRWEVQRFSSNNHLGKITDEEPKFMGITPDLTALKPVLETLNVTAVVLDKAYCDKNLENCMNTNGTSLITPPKISKGTAVAKIRQPIESFFNWIQQLTKNASKVRSENGLIVHIFGRFAASCLHLHDK